MIELIGNSSVAAEVKVGVELGILEICELGGCVVINDGMIDGVIEGLSVEMGTIVGGCVVINDVMIDGVIEGLSVEMGTIIGCFVITNDGVTVKEAANVSFIISVGGVVVGNVEGLLVIAGILYGFCVKTSKDSTMGVSEGLFDMFELEFAVGT